MKTSQQTMRAALLAVFVAFLTFFVSNVNAQLSEQSIIVVQDMVVQGNLTKAYFGQLPVRAWESYMFQGGFFIDTPTDHGLSGAAWNIDTYSEFQLTATVGVNTVRLVRTDKYGFGSGTLIDNTVNTPSMNFVNSIGVVTEHNDADGYMKAFDFRINGVSIQSDPIVADKQNQFEASTFTSEFGTVKPGDVFSMKVELYQPNPVSLNNGSFRLEMFEMHSIPEPSSVAVFLIGGAGILIFRRKRT